MHSVIQLRCAGRALALVALLGGLACAQAQSGNDARDRVKEREAAMLSRALGHEVPSIPRIEPRIVGGHIAAPGAWPFQVALLVAGIEDNYFAQFCGGSLIHPYFVLTAAHCAEALPRQQVRVLTGTQSLAVGGTRRRVTRVAIHPDWNDRTFDYDVALLQLETPEEDALPARMLARSEEPEFAAKGTATFVTGWGDTLSNGYPRELHEVSVPIVSRSNCNDGNSYEGAVTARMICAGLKSGGKDSCQGDSGGPLVVKDADGRWRAQAGIVSWGVGCAEPELYGVYTRVSVISSWVNRKLSHMLGTIPLAQQMFR